MSFPASLLLDHPDRTYRLEAGDSFHFRSEIPHRFRNPGARENRHRDGAGPHGLALRPCPWRRQERGLKP